VSDSNHDGWIVVTTRLATIMINISIINDLGGSAVETKVMYFEVRPLWNARAPVREYPRNPTYGLSNLRWLGVTTSTRTHLTKAE